MRRVVYISLAALLLVFLSSCTQLSSIIPNEESTTGQTTASEGGVKVYLTDKPPLADIEKLLVDIESIKYEYCVDGESSEITVPVSTEVDLLSLAGTEVEFFDMSEIPDGATLAYIKFEVPKATAIINEEPVDVNVINKSVKIPVNEEVVSDTDILLDFNVAESLIYKPGTNSYSLKPVLRHYMRKRERETNYDTGVVEGTVMYTDGTPVKLALVVLFDQDSSPVRMTMTSKKGTFVMGGIKAGEYELAVYTDYTLPENEDNELIFGTPDATKDVEIQPGETTRTSFEITE